MKNLSILIFALLFIFSGCISNTITDKSDKIPLEELPEFYTSEMAINNGDYVELPIGKIVNENVMADFLEKAEKNEEAYMRKVAYTVEGGALIYDFYYDNGEFNVIFDNTRDKYGGTRTIEEKTFKYLTTFESISGTLYLVVANKETNELLPEDDIIILKIIGEKDKKDE